MAQLDKKIVFTTELNADSVEWCPIPDYQHFFVCANYQLCKTDSDNGSGGERKGNLYLFRLVNGSEVIELDQKLSTDGILDCKWAHTLINQQIYLAVATAIGQVCIYRLKDDNSVTSLEVASLHTLSSPPSVIALSLDWSTGISKSDVKILVSDSAGAITLLTFTEGFLTENKKLKAHDYEAWIVAWNYWDTNVFYSGGDDCKFVTHDLRINQPVKNVRAHSGGVTSMHCNFKENSFVSGSYDENIAFWDVRKMVHPMRLLNVGGGVWRLKWEPNKCHDIAAACMHNGFATIDGANQSVLAEYKEHSSLAYGIDWCHLEPSELTNYFDTGDSSIKNVRALAMCSFYDNLLSLALFSC